MKACIFSMEYKIKNNDNTPKLKELGESYKDGGKVYKLFKNTLGWQEDDIITI
jgi:hypothetical protein